MTARLGVREAGFDGIEREGERKGERDGGGERGVRLVSHPLMIKTLSQSCRQPDLECLFLFPLWGGGRGCCWSWLSLRTQRELI